MEVAAMLIAGFVALTSMHIMLILSLNITLVLMFLRLINIGDFLLVVFCG